MGFDISCGKGSLGHGVGDRLDEVAVEVCGPAARAGFAAVTFQLLKRSVNDPSKVFSGVAQWIYTFDLLQAEQAFCNSSSSAVSRSAIHH
jgi:hypothetical protein